MSWLDSLGSYLVDGSFGVLGESLFLGAMPDGALVADPCLSILMEPGNVYFTAKPGVAVRQPMVELTARAASYTAAYALIESAWNSLQLISNQTIDGTKFMTVKSLGDITDQLRDENDRQVFTAHLEVWF